MSVEETDWLSRQAEVSALWLASLPADLLSPAAITLRETVGHTVHRIGPGQLSDVSASRPETSRRGNPGAGKRTAGRSVQAPLMMDIETDG